ncbi:hypothetical protein HZA76_02965 [Candidatus Roizmanbacteria bacterium]|nr:hypothetical protein [Candidatus Roizmanbacteria bacterium]
MHPVETPGGTPNYKFRYINTKAGSPPKVADLQKTIFGDMGSDANHELSMSLSDLNSLRGFDNFFMTRVAKQRPRNTDLQMKPESYVRMYDIVVGAKQFLGFDRSGNKQYKDGLSEEQLGNTLSSLLDKEPMEISSEIRSFQGKMSQSDFDYIITAYLSQGRVDFAMEMIKDVDKYLIENDKGKLKPEQLTETALTRIFDPNRNIGNNLFSTASTVVLGWPNSNEFYKEMRDSILKWPKTFIEAIPVQVSHLDTLLGKR